MRRSGLTAKASPGSALIMIPAPDDLTSQVTGFVCREDDSGSTVVRVLPEVRSSIQITLAAPYWLRARGPDAAWTRTPCVALWGPRYEWCYGYAARNIKTYAIILTPVGMQVLAGHTGISLVDKALALGQFNRDLEKDVMPLSDESFTSWTIRVTDVLREFFAGLPAVYPDLLSALEVLEVSEGGAVALAAQATGLSERHFRRIFKRLYGVPPKRYQRVLRVDRMLRRLHPAPWEHDARSEEPVPFADQPHFIREFRAMTGLTPLDYVERKRAGDKTLRSVTVDNITPPVDLE